MSVDFLALLKAVTEDVKNSLYQCRNVYISIIKIWIFNNNIPDDLNFLIYIYQPTSKLELEFMMLSQGISMFEVVKPMLLSHAFVADSRSLVHGSGANLNYLK